MAPSNNNPNHYIFNLGDMLEVYVKQQFAGKTGLLLPADEYCAEDFLPLRADLLQYGYDALANWEFSNGKVASPFPNPNFCDFFLFVEMPKSAAMQLQSKYEYLLVTVVNDGKITGRTFRSFFRFPPKKRKMANNINCANSPNAGGTK